MSRTRGNVAVVTKTVLTCGADESADHGTIFLSMSVLGFKDRDNSFASVLEEKPVLVYLQANISETVSDQEISEITAKYQRNRTFVA